MKNADGVDPMDAPLTQLLPIAGTPAYDDIKDVAALRATGVYAPEEPLPPARVSPWERGWRMAAVQNSPWVFPFCGMLELFMPGEGLVQGSCIAWFVMQPLFIYNVVHSVKRRRPPGDMGKVAPALVCSLGPWLLFMPFWNTLTAPGPLVGYLAFLVVWGSVFRWLAFDSWRRRWSSRFWTGVSYLAAATFALGAAAGLWLVSVAWALATASPPEIPPIPILLALLGLALAALGAWGATKCWAAAHQRSQAPAGT